MKKQKDKNKDKVPEDDMEMESSGETEKDEAASPVEISADDNIGPTAIPRSGNTHLRRLMDVNFLEYASYVIKDRAIPDVDDGLKPVQRRILWSLKRLDDGKFHKVANVVGHTMQYHPHGDASIYEALVVVANKEYFIDRQGNFGNIFTGDVASAARYIECRLNSLAKEVLFNNDITEFVDSYDGRNREPVSLPVKIPALLMLGADGIAVGMSTKILSHNFNELIEAQIAILKGEKFTVYPDFLQGGLMDVTDYNEGNGKIVLRAKIEKNGRKLIIREIPAVTNTEKLIASIENAVRKNKIKVSSINDYTGEKIEIEVTPARGYDTDKALNALYAYTDCSVSVSASLIVIADNKPVKMSVSEVLRRNTEKLVEYLRRELEIELGKLNDSFHDKTLAQIFIENRIYKRIEKCETYEKVLKEVHEGLIPFRHMLKRDVTDADIEKLLAIPIRRISLFDINKNKKDIDDIILQIEEVQKNLKRLKAYAIKYLKGLLDKYGKDYPRHTEIEIFDKIDVREVALNNIKVGWDKKNGFIGTSVKSDDTVTCNEYDRLLCIERNGKYKVISIPDKAFVGRLVYFCKYDKNLVFNIVYKDRKTDFSYAKRTVISKFITDKEYNIAPDGCKIDLINTRPNYVYECVFEPKTHQKQKSCMVDFSQVGMRTPQSRGFSVANKKIIDYRFVGVSDGQGNIVQPDSETAEGEPQLPTPGDASLSAELSDPVTEPAAETPKPVKARPEEKPVEEEKPSKKETPNEKAAREKEDEKLELEAEDPEKMKVKKGKGAKPEIAKSSKPAVDKKETKSEKKSEPKKKENPPKPVKGPKKGGSDEWGIAQPEFGF
ncbi:MAG: DNA topoisomerase IV subunit A [Victivallales bacterium]|jgi:topoisomerase-4 subunit A